MVAGCISASCYVFRNGGAISEHLFSDTSVTATDDYGAKATRNRRENQSYFSPKTLLCKMRVLASSFSPSDFIFLLKSYKLNCC